MVVPLFEVVAAGDPGGGQTIDNGKFAVVLWHGFTIQIFQHGL